MPWPWALNGPGEDLRPDLLVRNAFRLLPSADRLVHQKAQADFSPAWAGAQWAVSNSAFWCENRRFGQFIPTFPLCVSPGKILRYTSQDDMSLTFKHLFVFFFLVTKTCSFFYLSGHFCAKKKRENGRCWKNVPEKCGPHKLPDGRGDAISLTTGQQKSSHALDKGA